MTLTLAPETEARLRAVATEKNMAPEAVIDAALEALLNPEAILLQAPKEVAAQDTPEQARLRAVLLEVIAKAQALEGEPRQEQQEQAPEERLFGEIITEKYRGQGFQLP